MDEQLTQCLQLMQQTIDLVDNVTRFNNITKLCSLINPEPPFEVPGVALSLVKDERVENLLELLVSKCIFPEVNSKEFHTKFDKDIFKEYACVSCALLDCVINYLTLKSNLYQRSDGNTENFSNKPCECHKTTNNSSFLIERINHAKDFQLLPSLLFLVGGNIRNPVWSSEACQTKSKRLLDTILTFTNCHDLVQLLTNGCNHQHDSILGMKMACLKSKTLLNVIFHLFEKPLSRQQWENNRYFCEVFIWLVLLVKSPHLSNHIDQIIATCLNFIQSHENDAKLDGLQCLKHLIQNSSREELTWFNRAEVLYETIKTQLYAKDSSVLNIAIECMVLNLKVLEKSCLDKSVKHQEIMSLLLAQCEMEQFLANRRILMTHVANLIVDYGILVIQHLANILVIIESFLEIEDLPDEVARIQALRCLENILSIAWPRICHHSHHILQFLLKCVINIDVSHSHLAKNELLQKVSVCVDMLLKIDPQLYSVIDEINSSQELECLQKLLSCLQRQTQSLSTDSS